MADHDKREWLERQRRDPRNWPYYEVSDFVSRYFWVIVLLAVLPFVLIYL